MGGKGDRPDGLENRWWVDQQKDAQGHLIERPRRSARLRFFRTGAGFEQDRAQRRLTDLNLKWFDEADAPPGGWAVIHMLEHQRVPEPRVDKVTARAPGAPGRPRRARRLGRGAARDHHRRCRSASAWSRCGWASSPPSTPGCTASGCGRSSSATSTTRCAAVPRLVREYLTTARGAPIG